MPVSGLVLSLADDVNQRHAVMAALRAEPHIDIGRCEAGRLAIVAETASCEEDKQLWQWLQTLPGVLEVRIAMVGFE